MLRVVLEVVLSRCGLVSGLCVIVCRVVFISVRLVLM